MDQANPKPRRCNYRCTFFSAMEPDVESICNALAEWAPEELAESWDNVGLQVGDPGMKVSSVLVSLDPTRAAVERARSIGARMIVTHHPLLFRPVAAMDLSLPVPGIVADLIRSEMALASAHTNLDSAAGGVSEVLAELIGLEDTIPVVPHEARKELGLGRVGRLRAPERLGDVASRLMDLLECPALMVLGDPGALVQRIAVCGGSGSDLWPSVRAISPHLYITGEIKHHVAREAEEMEIALIDAGHFYTEKPATYRIAERLSETASERGWDLRIDVFKEEAPPMRYRFREQVEKTKKGVRT